MAALKYNFKIILLSLFFIFHSSDLILSYEKPDDIRENTWNRIEPHLLPENHAIKPALDALFSASRATLCLESLESAGFINPKVREWTHIVVTKHPDIPGYIFKIYLDAQRCFNNKKEYDYWLMRIEGVRAIKEELQRRNWEDRFKTPTKWMYMLPQEPAPPEEFIKKDFILVEEDMDIYDDEQNYKLWKSNSVTKEFLKDFYHLCEELGLYDCAKPDNAPFSKDGKIAFIDTQTIHQWPVNYTRMSRYLSQKMQSFWKKLTSDSKSTQENVMDAP